MVTSKQNGGDFFQILGAFSEYLNFNSSSSPNEPCKFQNSFYAHVFEKLLLLSAAAVGCRFSVHMQFHNFFGSWKNFKRLSSKMCDEKCFLFWHNFDQNRFWTKSNPQQKTKLYITIQATHFFQNSLPKYAFWQKKIMKQNS